jgi:hypothetical protein
MIASLFDRSALFFNKNGRQRLMTRDIGKQPSKSIARRPRQFH